MGTGGGREGAELVPSVSASGGGQGGGGGELCAWKEELMLPLSEEEGRKQGREHT